MTDDERRELLREQRRARGLPEKTSLSASLIELALRIFSDGERRKTDRREQSRRAGD